MKKIIFQSFYVISYPFRIILKRFKFFKKIKIDNFVGGLIFGAIFSLIVNVVTVQLQENINKQHILEAVENEILNNTLQANNIMKTNLEKLKKNEMPNVFYVMPHYADDLWTQSSEPLQYIAQLDQENQLQVTGYYTVIVTGVNSTIDRLREITDEKMKNCFFDTDKNTLDNTQIQVCNTWGAISLEQEMNNAAYISGEGFKVLEKFHPTQDRLNNRLMKLIMGDKSTKILSGK